MARASDTSHHVRRSGIAPALLLQAALDAIPEGVICVEPDGQVITWSEGARRLYGFTADEAVGRPFCELIVPDDRRDPEEQTRLAVMAGGEVPRFEVVRRRKDGSRLEVTVVLRAIRDPSGQAVGLCSIEREVHEARGEAEVHRLQERDRLRTEFMSEASHELNTPLTPIRLQLQLLKLAPGLGPKEIANLDAIERNVLRLAGLVHDMLEASRLQAGRFKLERTRVDLSNLVEDAAESFREQANQEGLRLDIVCAPRLFVQADTDRTMQVLFNLLSNALKYNAKGGLVEVGTKRHADHAIAWVRDTGVGLTPEQVGKLFRPFARVHDTRSGGPKGTGLGLFICKGIVEEHGGRIWVESEGPGKGSTWSFTIPLASRPPAGTPTELQTDPEAQV
ncbi:MAG TPA: PAS domain-containing sensor histidine kinase [Candidatus Thermoplasmatota archaeon]|nr:PAS domain-containing sensor histidine kinase [Candidatus Thermoplasmatota archaeon]